MHHHPTTILFVLRVELPTKVMVIGELTYGNGRLPWDEFDKRLELESHPLQCWSTCHYYWRLGWTRRASTPSISHVSILSLSVFLSRTLSLFIYEHIASISDGYGHASTAMGVLEMSKIIDKTPLDPSLVHPLFQFQSLPDSTWQSGLLGGKSVLERDKATLNVSLQPWTRQGAWFNPFENTED